MRDLSKGSYCRHRLKKEWGYGQVKEVALDRITIFFEHVGNKPIARQYLVPMLQPVPLDKVPVETVAILESGPQKATARKSTLTEVDRACQACSQPLKRVVFADKRNWKSCPNCSSRNGSFHMFYEYPRSFEQSGPTASGKPTGHGHRECSECREEKPRGAAPRFCGTL